VVDEGLAGSTEAFAEGGRQVRDEKSRPQRCPQQLLPKCKVARIGARISMVRQLMNQQLPCRRVEEIYRHGDDSVRLTFLVVAKGRSWQHGTMPSGTQEGKSLY